MSEEKKATHSFLQKLKDKAANSKTYGGDVKPDEAGMAAGTCPNCGAGRAKQEGLTHCAYCGYEFMQVKLTDGLNIKKDDNSNA